MSSRALDHAVAAYHTFPPAFDNNAAAYGFALFGLIMLASVSLAQIVRLWRNLDFHRDGYNSPITLGRVILMGLYASLFTTTFPDVITLLLWNEVSQETMEALWATDRWFDALALIPFSVSVFLSFRSEARLVDQLLLRAPPPVDFIPTTGQMKRLGLIILISAAIAGGVALGKVSGAV